MTISYPFQPHILQTFSNNGAIKQKIVKWPIWLLRINEKQRPGKKIRDFKLTGTIDSKILSAEQFSQAFGLWANRSGIT